MIKIAKKMYERKVKSTGHNFPELNNVKVEDENYPHQKFIFKL